MSQQEMPIFTRTFDFLTWLLPATNHFPRAHRHTFTSRLLNAAFDLREHLEAANHCLGKQRMAYLDAADGDLERARQAYRGAAPGAAAFRLEEGAAAKVAGAPDDAVDRSGLSANDLAALSGVSQ